MRKLIDKLRFWLAKMIGGSTLEQLGGYGISARLDVITPTLRPTAIQVPKDDPYRYDKLDRQDFGTGLCKLLSFGDNSGAIFLDGEWGTGKTTFLKMLAEQLRNHDEGSKGKIVIEMNAWENDAFREPIEYIAEKIREGLKEHKKTMLPKRWQQWVFGPWIVAIFQTVTEVPYLSTIFPTGYKELFACLRALHKMVNLLERIEKPTNYHSRMLDDLKKDLALEAKEIWNSRGQTGPRRIIVIIDELDRCRPDYAIRFLETMKHVFEVEQVRFLLAVDKGQLIHSIKGVYGSDFNGEQYLERFGDIWLTLPDSPRSELIAGILDNIRFEHYLPKDTNDDDALNGITANDMMISVMERANKNLREIEKIALETRAMLFLSQEHIKDCAIGVIALALARHVAPEVYMDLTNLESDGENPARRLSDRLFRRPGDDAPGLTLVYDMLNCLYADARRRKAGSSSSGVSEEEHRWHRRRHLANYIVAQRAIEVYGSETQSGDENIK